ncbi:MAG: four helix bundle protein [Kiritimatiellia bacterium]|jgi:four helix bundle protein|nr:four helix bundle protein [Kiritimatiellia bacterium]
MNKDRTFDLRERLLDYAVRIVKLSESLPATRVGAHIAGQILRSGTSTAANYAEAQSAESKTDFVHKLKVALKELRETNIWLRIICKSGLISPDTMLAPLLKETDDLMAILFTSIETAKKRKP